MTSIPNIIIG